MGKILSAAPAAFPVRLNPNDKPYLSGILDGIEKAIKATARTITRTRLNDRIKSDIVLQRAGLRSLTQAVSEIMATAIWKGRREMNPLGCIFQNKPSPKNTRSATSDKLRQTVPGYLEVAANKHAQIWNVSNLSAAKSLGHARALACEWYKKNAKLLLRN